MTVQSSQFVVDSPMPKDTSADRTGLQMAPQTRPRLIAATEL